MSWSECRSVDDGVSASCESLGEASASSGLAIRSPPRALDRLRSPFMIRVQVGGGLVVGEGRREKKRGK